MEKKITVLISKVLSYMMLPALVYSCNFAQSVNKDLVTGMVTRGNGLSCNEVYLASEREVLKRNTFTYGEAFKVHFDGIDGFNRTGQSAFPGMQLVVVSQQGDTVMFQRDLYADFTEGVAFSPLELYAEVTVADPIHSKDEYTLYVNIWDKKGNGTFKANLDFTVIPSDKIEITSNQISYNEIYLYSKEKGSAITDNRAGFNETIYMLFEGLDGFVVESRTVHIGVSMILKDADGNMILNEQDLIGDAGMSYTDVHTKLATNFIFTGSQISNPVTCEISIWDKKGPATIKGVTQLNVQ